MNINELLKSLTSQADTSNAGLDAQLTAAQGTTAGMRSSAATMEEAVTKSIAQSGQAAQQAAEIARRKAAVGEQAQIVAGLDPDDLNNEYVRTMAALTTTRDQRQASAQEYRRLTETSFLDNPIGYIFNQMALPQVVQKHNNLATQQDALASDLSTRTALMAQNKTAVTANVAGMAKEVALLEASAAESAAKAKAEQVRMENFGKIAVSSMNEQAILNTKLANTATLYSAGMSMAQFNALQEERAENRAERVAAAALRAADKAEKDAQEGALAVGLARVSGALGYPIPLSIANFKKMPASKAKQKLYDAAVEGTFGSDLSESLNFLSSGNAVKMQANDPAFVRGVTNIAAGVKTYATLASRTALSTPGAKPLSPEEASKLGADNYVIAVTLSAHDPKATRGLNDPHWDTTFNPNRSQDSVMLAMVKAGTAPALANNSYVKVLETVAATMPPGTPEFRGEDRTRAIQALAELVRTRKISVQQAATDLRTYTRTAANYNQATMNLSTLSISKQESAYVSVPGASWLSTPFVGDTMSQAGAENLLTKIAVSQAKLQGFGRSGFVVN